MENFGFVRVAAAVPSVNVADIDFNINSIISMAKEANELGIDILCFPELCVTGYSCGDLFRQSILIDNAIDGLIEIAKRTAELSLSLVVGAPIRWRNGLFNCAVVISDGVICGIIPKSYIPNNNEFYERRWFESGLNIFKQKIHIGNRDIPFGIDMIFERGDAQIAVELCEDLWMPVPPSSISNINGANIILNLSASNEVIGKHDYLINLIRQQSARCHCAYIYASAGYGESSTDLVFSGNAIIAEDGTILAESPRFTARPQLYVADIDLERLMNDRSNSSSFNDSLNLYTRPYSILSIPLPENRKHKDSLIRQVNPYPFIPDSSELLAERCLEITGIQTEGLMRRLEASHTSSLVIGISGGLDSTLALLIAVEAFDRLGIDRKKIIGITMPGFGTTTRTHSNADILMKRLGVTSVEIPIENAVYSHFSDIEHNTDIHDITYENSQARERTQILMDYANKSGALVLGTGDLSELALGWCTYNGDHMSMYAINSSIPKTLVRHLVQWFANTSNDMELCSVLLDIIDTPISPELIPADSSGNIAQKTEDLVGPYELHDFFLYNTLRFGYSPRKIHFLACIAFSDRYQPQTISYWIKIFFKRFFSQQFKRSCLPDGPKVGSACLSPRGDWRMPSDASASIWLKECDSL